MNKVCCTSVIITLIKSIFASTCEISSFHPYLRLPDRNILPHSRMGSRYQFNKLLTNTSHKISVSYTFAHDNSIHGQRLGNVITKASLRKLSK